MARATINNGGAYPDTAINQLSLAPHQSLQQVLSLSHAMLLIQGAIFEAQDLIAYSF